MKKIILLLAICSMSIASFAATGGAVNATINWTLDDEGTLTISGTGDMPDYAYDKQPWRSIRSSILHVIIGEGITSIGQNNIFDCRNLESIIIPNTIEFIEYGAIAYTDKLTKINIPASVKNIANGAFSSNNQLTSVVVSENNEFYSSYDGVLYNKTKTSLLFYPIGKKNKYFSIPYFVTTLGDFAFLYCCNLKTIYIPNSVKTIGDMSACDLTAIIINNDIPPTTSNFCWAGLPKSSPNCVLYIPKNSITIYSNNPIWQYFKDYLPIAIKSIDVETISNLFTWQKVEDATGYQLIIYSNVEKTNILYILNFTKDGKYISTQPAKPQFAVAETENFSYQITGLENNTNYFYTLTAFQDEEIIAEQEGSFKTNETTALPAVKESDINLYVSGKNIIIENAQSKNIQIFNIFGQTLANVKNSSETAQIPMQNTGIYLVKIGLETVKVVIE